MLKLMQALPNIRQYVEPATSANKSILYLQLYEELKTIM